MEFWMERTPSHSHGGATGFKPPPGVTVNQIPPEKSIGSMMVSGELDAVIFYLLDPNLVDRSTIDLHSHPDIKPLFPDPAAEGVRYYRKTGIYPINHGMVIKRELAETASLGDDQHPQGVQAGERRSPSRSAMEQVEYHVETGLLPAAAQKAWPTPLISHGVAANRQVLETIAQYSLEQGLTPRLMKLEDLFGPSMLSQ